MKKIIIVLLFATISLIGYSQHPDSTSVNKKIIFPALTQINLTPSPIISLHLKKLPAYDLQSTCNTCPNRVNERYLYTQDKDLAIVHNLVYNYTNSSINFNPYNALDTRVALLSGGLNLLFNALLDSK